MELESAVQEAEAQMEKWQSAQRSVGLRLMQSAFRRWESDQLGVIVLRWFDNANATKGAVLARQLRESRERLRYVKDSVVVTRMKHTLAEWSENLLLRLLWTWKMRVTEGDSSLQLRLDQTTRHLHKVEAKVAVKMMREVMSVWVREP